MSSEMNPEYLSAGSLVGSGEGERQALADRLHQQRLTGRKPVWWGFDASWYLLRYPDVPAWMAEAGYDNPELFYQDIGGPYGHSPNRYFDEAWYCARYPDVRKAVARKTWRTGFAHYCAQGYGHYAPHWLFDEKSYRQRYPQLTEHVLARSALWNGYDHYLSRGEAEGFSAGPFFDSRLCRMMAQHVPDYFALSRVGNAGDPANGLLASWLVLPSAVADLMPCSWYFDPVWYLERYPEVRGAIENGRYANTLHHYLTNETPSLFNPSAFFSESFYQEHAPDILSAVQAGSFRNGYDHFVRFGARESRQPADSVFLDSYARNPLVRAQCESGSFESAFARYVAEQKGFCSIAGTPLAIDDKMPTEIPESQARALFEREAEALLLGVARSPLDFRFQGAPEVSVIMVVHNQIALTIQALSSLRANYGGSVEVILVNSGSEDETCQIERLIKGAVILHYRANIGYLEGCNAALKKVSAPSVLYLNNDVRLYPDALRHALARLYSGPSIGAVAAKLVRSNMKLQEAGSIIWRNGATYGYRREDDPNLSEANFVREIDYGSAAFLLARTGIIRRLGGYDTRYLPAYFEDTDLCVRLRKYGAKIVYEPLCVVEHLEFGSSGHVASHALIQRQWDIFARTHQTFLRYQQPQHIRNALLGRERRDMGRKRILFIEDRIPLRSLGSGYVRSNDIIHMMDELNYHVTVFPVYSVQIASFLLYREFPEGVELALEQNVETLPSFLEERAGYYDLIWIGRTHNMARLLPILNEAARFLPGCGAILDTEVVAAPRTLLQQQILRHDTGSKLSLDKLLEEELRCAHYCQQIVTVTEQDAALVRRAGYSDVRVLGHTLPVRPTPRSFAARNGLLFLGAMHDVDSPNYDSMLWFVREVMPYFDDMAEDFVLYIAGYTAPGVDLTPLAEHPRVEILGSVEELAPIFDQYRVFVAPTRFAGGLPFKVHEAASYGLPMVVTTILKEQVGWQEGEALLSGDATDPQGFAASVRKLYDDQALWQKLRCGAMEALARDASPEKFRQALSDILDVSLSS